jgi:cell division GTPase FtsZ
MKLALLGVGNAGTRIVDQLVAAEQRTDRPMTEGQVLAFNTTPSAFEETENIDDKRQVVVGDIHPDVVQPDDITESEGESDGGADETAQREGVAGNPELGVSVARDDLPEMRRALDMIEDTEVDAAMIVTGLGGGTGCGVGSVLLEELKGIYEIPVYVLGVLPTSEESDQRAWTAARAIQTFVPLADSVIPVDNESWIDKHGASEDYEALNRAIATRIVSVFGTGERDDQTLSELQMDPNDVRRVLEIGGLATVGYAETELEEVSESWLTRLRRLVGLDVAEPEPQTDAVSIKKLVQRAVESELTLPCDIETADRVLLILSGPPEELSRKGFETGRYLLEDETGTVEVLAGDEPLPDTTRITATVLLSNVTGVPRIEALQERAVAFQRERNSQSVDDEHGFQFRKESVDEADNGDEIDAEAEDEIEAVDSAVDTGADSVDAAESETGDETAAQDESDVDDSETEDEPTHEQ